ncbi:MAG: DUF5017 domain-containing protein [Bacteroidota bacterium]|nr:DUF5017 domain-containing protein [Bacteroidota bacterium]
MKKIIYSILPLLGVLWLSSCNKDIVPYELSFDVKVFNNAQIEKDTFRVNDTINFKFSGNPDFITFYSGELGREYRNVNRTSQKSYLDTLSFSSKMDTVASSGNGTLKLYVSTNLKAYTQYNTADSLAVLAAGWKDISSRATWATSTTTVSSGKISLNAEAQTDSLVWLAFRYQASPNVAQSSWSITNILLKHTADNATYTLLTPATVVPTTFPSYSLSPGWGVVDLQKRIGTRGWIPYNGTSISATGGPSLVPATGQSYATSASTNRLAVTGSFKDPTSATNVDTWIIAGPIDLSRVYPDYGVQIKNYSENAMTMSKGFYASLKANYTYKFTKAGTYTVVFVAGNATKDGQVSGTKSVTITVR